MDPKESFTGTLKVDTDAFPATGVTNLAGTPATFTVTVPQLGGATFTMADFTMFSVGITKADVAKLAAGQDLVSTQRVTQVLIYGKLGTPAHKKFNACSNEFGICFNRDAVGPVYNLTSMIVK